MSEDDLAVRRRIVGCVGVVKRKGRPAYNVYNRVYIYIYIESTQLVAPSVQHHSAVSGAELPTTVVTTSTPPCTITVVTKHAATKPAATLTTAANPLAATFLAQTAPAANFTSAVAAFTLATTAAISLQPSSLPPSAPSSPQ